MFKGFVKLFSGQLKLQPEKIGASLQNHKQANLKLKDVLRTLCPEDLTNFLWLSILKPNSHFNAYTLAILRKIDLREAQKSIASLTEKRLLVKVESEQKYFIHESLRVFATHLLTSQKHHNSEIKRLGIKWVDAHQKLILSFQNSNSYSIQNKEIYFIKNLDWHLQEGEWDDKIHSIVSHTFPLNQWKYQISQDIVHCNLETSNLILIAERDCKWRFQENPNENLLLLSKYKLMKNIQTHALQNIPAQWIKILVETQTWPEAKALAYIKSQSSSERIADCIDILKEILSPESLEKLLDIIAEINCDAARAQAIKSIFAQLNSKNKKRALSLIQNIKLESYRSMSLGAIAPHTPVPLMQTVFTAIQAIQDQKFKTAALERFLPYFTLPLKKKSLEIIKNTTDNAVRFRLLSRLEDTFPQIKSDLFDLAPELATDYVKLSTLWNLLDRKEQHSQQIIQMLDQCSSNLDKVLFLADLILEANPKQLQDIWAIALSFEDETLWGNTMVELLPFVSSKDISTIITRVSTIKSEELKGELCIQIFPFADSPAQSEQLCKIIQSIESSSIKGIITSQILDYLPEGLSIVLQSLQKITDPIKQLDIKINLLEYDISWGEIVIQDIQKLSDETLKTHFLSQVIYLLPNHLIPKTTDLVFRLQSSKYRDSLLNQLAPRLEIQDIKQSIVHLTQETYPVELFKNVSKQINRHYWESSITDSVGKLTQGLLDQLPNLKTNTPKIRTEDILEDIFNLQGTSNQSKILSLCLHDIQWETLKPETLLKIMTSLSRGSSLELLKNLPILTQGVEALLGTESLPAYGNICYQLSQPKPMQSPLTHQSKGNISHIDESQELWPEIA